MNTLFSGPYYRIIINGNPFTGELDRHLISLTLTEYSGGQSDQLTLVLDDSNDLSRLSVPTRNSTIMLSLGYETYFTPKGLYLVDSRQLSGPPDTLTISAKAVDMLSELNDPHDKTWPEQPGIPSVSLATIVQTIATNNLMVPAVSSIFFAPPYVYPQRHQYRESDLQFLGRLAYENNALIKVAQRTIIFVEQAVATNTYGLPFWPVMLSPNGIINWSMAFGDRFKYGLVQADYHDVTTGQTTRIGVTNPGSSADKVYTMTPVFHDETTAKAAAEAQLERFRQEQDTLALTVLGDPALRPLVPIQISDVRRYVNDTWLVDQVTHQISSQGYTCSVQAFLQK